MNPTGLRNHLVIGDVCKEMGEPELVAERIHKYRRMKERYGNYSVIKEGHRGEIMSFVFDGRPEAEEQFAIKEQNHLSMGPGLIETLDYLVEQGIRLSVVAELKKTLGPIGTDNVSRFLTRQNLVKYFGEMITPQGMVNLKDGARDLKYKGKTKEEGTLYDELVKDLRDWGIEPSEGVMVGDKIATDILPARKRGFKTIQYTGYIDYGPSEADTRIHDFRELKEIIRKKR
jgi:phosphoglycolate phosphatase-like HAD superfamily hydrolase